MATTINDPIYSSITIRDAARLVLETPEVQRLRDLRQLGVVNYVYPSAVHTRFEHSLGCMHLAEEFLSAIEKNHQHLGVTIYQKEDQCFFGEAEGSSGGDEKEGKGESVPPPDDAAGSSPKRKRIKGELTANAIPSPPSLKGEEEEEGGGGGGEREIREGEQEEYYQQRMNRAGRITSQDYDCLAIAGLCHDLGHGPFSHLFEHLVNHDWKHATKNKNNKNNKNKKEEWSHEDMSLLLLNRIWKRLEHVFLSEYGLTSEDHAFVQLLMTGLPPNAPFPCHKVGRPAWKRFMVDIVANKVNGLDVDKLDYLQRDGFFTGHRESFQLRRLFQNAFVVPVPKSHDSDDGAGRWGKPVYEDTPSGQYRICYADKMETEVKQIFDCRLKMHKLVYLHRVVIQTQRMVRDILCLCGDVQCITKEHSSSSSSSDDDDDDEDDEDEDEGGEEEEESGGGGKVVVNSSMQEGNEKAERRRRTPSTTTTTTTSTALMQRGGEEKKMKRERERRRKKRGGQGGRLYSLKEAVWNPSIFSCTGDWVLKLFRHMDIYTVPLHLSSSSSSLCSPLKATTTTSPPTSTNMLLPTMTTGMTNQSKKKETSDLHVGEVVHSCSRETILLSEYQEEEDMNHNNDEDGKKKKNKKNGGEGDTSGGAFSSSFSSSSASVELLLPSSRRDTVRITSYSPPLPSFLPPERHCLFAAQSLLKRLEVRKPYNYLGVIRCDTAKQVGYATDSFLLLKIMEELRAHHVTIYNRLREWEREHAGLPALCSERIQFSLATKECQTSVEVGDVSRIFHPPSYSRQGDGRFVESGGGGGGRKKNGGRGKRSPEVVVEMKLHPKVIVTYVNTRDFLRACRREEAALALHTSDTHVVNARDAEDDGDGVVEGCEKKKKKNEKEEEEDEDDDDDDGVFHCQIMHNNARPLEAETAEDERFVYWLCRLPRPSTISGWCLPSPPPPRPPNEEYEGGGGGEGKTNRAREKTGGEGALTVREEMIIMETIKKVFVANHPKEELGETDSEEEEEPEVRPPDHANVAAAAVVVGAPDNMIPEGGGGGNHREVVSGRSPLPSRDSSSRFSSSQRNSVKFSPSPSHPSGSILSSVHQSESPVPALNIADDGEGGFSSSTGGRGSLRSRSLMNPCLEGSGALRRHSSTLAPEDRISMKRQKSN